MSSEITAILKDEVYQDIERTDAFCAKILDKKKTSEFIKDLNTRYPILNLEHLRRVKKEGEERNRNKYHTLGSSSVFSHLV